VAHLGFKYPGACNHLSLVENNLKVAPDQLRPTSGQSSFHSR